MNNEEQYTIDEGESKIAKDGRTKLYRLIARVTFENNFEGTIKDGTKGGWVSCIKKPNGDALVSGNAWVSGDAEVSGNARVSGDALVYGDARVSGNAWVSGDAEVSGNARVSGDARVFGNARVYGNAWVYGDVLVYGNAWVSGNARVSGDALVSGDVWVSGNVKLTSCLGGRFSFEFDWQVELWQEKEREYEDTIKERLKTAVKGKEDER